MAKYKYLNVNPDNVKESDCVTRAITLISNLPYDEVRRKLFHTARLLNCNKLCVCCYRFLIEKVLNYKPVNCDYMTIGEFADKNPYGKFLGRTNGHIVGISDGCVYDIFDSRNLLLTDAWEVTKG